MQQPTSQPLSFNVPTCPICLGTAGLTQCPTCRICSHLQCRIMIAFTQDPMLQRCTNCTLPLQTTIGNTGGVQSAQPTFQQAQQQQQQQQPQPQPQPQQQQQRQQYQPPFLQTDAPTTSTNTNRAVHLAQQAQAFQAQQIARAQAMVGGRPSGYWISEVVGPVASTTASRNVERGVGGGSVGGGIGGDGGRRVCRHPPGVSCDLCVVVRRET